MYIRAGITQEKALIRHLLVNVSSGVEHFSALFVCCLLISVRHHLYD